ncbi:unnamed protein product [Prorocentrum cordatum]|uniref:Bifunctional lysine-specific demethylase and histidyl-hydroxylase n=1 Tax=Prorocentrum cordatum TaxID=2364126 RepID=A0ABN9TSC3_9DINO|nr:unnamed protein product [Polarella glacialis]
MGDIDQLEKLTSGSITFDASSSGEFAYWDNNSLLAPIVRDVGVAGQGYTKVTGKKRGFFAALRKGQGSPFGAVRYGGPIKTHFGDLDVEQEHLAELPLAGSRSLSLWLSSAGSYSTAHMDSFHNVFISGKNGCCSHRRPTHTSSARTLGRTRWRGRRAGISGWRGARVARAPLAAC